MNIFGPKTVYIQREEKKKSDGTLISSTEGCKVGRLLKCAICLQRDHYLANCSPETFNTLPFNAAECFQDTRTHSHTKC